MSADELAENVARIGRVDDFDVAFNGYSDPSDRARQRYAEAGATWWLENLHDTRGSKDEVLARVEAGP
jgi:predicted ATPase